MTFEELDRELELKIESLTNKQEKNCYLFISSFNYEINDLEDFINFDYLGFMTAYYYLHHKDIEMEKINAFINNLIELLKNLNDTEIDFLISNLFVIKKNNYLEDLKKYFDEKNDIAFLNNLKNINAMIPLKFMNLKKKVIKYNIDISYIINEFKDNEEILINILKFYQVYQKMVSIIKNISKDKKNINKSHFDIHHMLLENDDIEKVISMMNEIEDYLKEYERIDRNNQKEILNLLTAKNTLQDNLKEKQYIVNYYEIINNIKDLRIRNLFLQVIKNHNMKYLNKLEDEYGLLTKDTKLEIIALLNDYGIIKNSYNIDIIMRLSKEDIVKLLKIINVLNINNDDKVNILENANIDNINAIKEYLDRGILNKDVLHDNLNMFVDITKLNYLKNNLDIIKKCNLSISLFISNSNILLEDSKLFNKNLNILSVYNLIKGLSTSHDLSYLSRNDLDTMIDKYLELGCEKYLENDLSLLNKNNLQKLELLNILGIGVNSKDELDNLLMDDSFAIPESEMNTILNKKRDLKDENITINLDDFLETNRVYNFDGIRVSVIKVKRLLSFGYSLYDAITYNMYIKEEKQNKLIDLLVDNKNILI